MTTHLGSVKSVDGQNSFFEVNDSEQDEQIRRLKLQVIEAEKKILRYEEQQEEKRKGNEKLIAKLHDLEERKRNLCAHTQTVDEHMSKSLKERKKVKKRISEEPNLQADILLDEFARDSEHIRGCEILR